MEGALLAAVPCLTWGSGQQAWGGGQGIMAAGARPAAAPPWPGSARSSSCAGCGRPSQTSVSHPLLSLPGH